MSQPDSGRPALVSVTLVHGSSVLSTLTRSLGSRVAIGAEFSSGSGRSPSGAATENIADIAENSITREYL